MPAKKEGAQSIDADATYCAYEVHWAWSMLMRQGRDKHNLEEECTEVELENPPMHMTILCRKALNLLLRLEGMQIRGWRIEFEQIDPP